MSYLETTNPADVTIPADIKYFDFGMGFQHNMPCCIHADNTPAVLDTSHGVFTPSWRAQRNGWHLVQVKQTRLAMWLHRLLGRFMFSYHSMAHDHRMTMVNRKLRSVDLK